jgi:hypothetical protein
MKNFTPGKLFPLFLSAILNLLITSYSHAQCEITSGAPTVNTTIESIWSSATIHPMTLPLPSTSTPSGFSAQWRCLYTSTTLYFLFEVTKTGSLYNQNGANWWEDDAVEIYLDGNNSKGTSYDGTNDFQFGFRYNDGAVVQTGGSNPANSTTGIVYNFYTTTAGYNVEISIPWSTLGVTATIGNSFGIEAGVDVSNGPDRITQMLTYDGTGHAYENPSLFGTVTLETCPIAPILNETTNKPSLTVSPNPFSNQTLISLPAIDSYSLSIFNVTGETVKEYSILHDDKVSITSDGIENGIYYYSVKNIATNKVYGGKLVINR